MNDYIDLRSDTVTRPTAAMRAAMAAAEVGDDVYDEDPTVNRLQEMAAKLLGKEAALLVPTGTMANIAAIKVHTHPGDEILLDTDAHSMYYEAGNPAALAQALTRQFRSRHGVPDPLEIESLIHVETLHTPRTALIMLENTHNRAGGYAIPFEVLQALGAIAKSLSVAIHIDGARLFNAAAVTGIPAAKLVECADSVTFCLSKGLGCPVGSVLCGDVNFIAKAKRVRKMLGGGMRQAGVLAAAGIYALENHIARLDEDHRNARRLAHGLSGCRGIELETLNPPSNMVFIRTEQPADLLLSKLRVGYGVLATSMGSHRIRFVTHLDATGQTIDRAVERIVQALASPL